MSAKMMHVVLATVVAAVMMTPEVAASAGTIGRRLKSTSKDSTNGPVVCPEGFEFIGFDAYNLLNEGEGKDKSSKYRCGGKSFNKSSKCDKSSKRDKSKYCDRFCGCGCKAGTIFNPVTETCIPAPSSPVVPVPSPPVAVPVPSPPVQPPCPVLCPVGEVFAEGFCVCETTGFTKPAGGVCPGRCGPGQIYALGRACYCLSDGKPKRNRVCPPSPYC